MGDSDPEEEAAGPEEEAAEPEEEAAEPEEEAAEPEEGWAPLELDEGVAPQARVASAPDRCPYCHEGFDDLQEVAPLECRSCGAWQHLGCVGESKPRSCGSCGGQPLDPTDRRSRVPTSWATNSRPDLFVLVLGAIAIPISFAITATLPPEDRPFALNVLCGVFSVLLFGYFLLRWLWKKSRGELEPQVGLIRRRSKLRSRPSGRARKAPAKDDGSELDKAPERVPE